AEPLHPTRTATTVRIQRGKPLISDGPFAETKEQLAGYYILDCRDLDEALEWAARIPTTCQGGSGCIEVRPIVAQPQQHAHDA
ncbi:MAG: YciI family protein, partial [Terriglobales bacterium]